MFKFSYILILFFVGSIRVSSQAESETLIFAQIIFRHGNRNILAENKIPSDDNCNLSNWPEGYGMLTRNGKIKMYLLGDYFRARYTNFTDLKYSRGEAWIRSSEYERTILSAKEAADGFFPQREISDSNIDLSPIPIYTISPEVDNLIGYVPENCPRYRKLFREYLNSSEEMIRINRENEPLYKYLEKHTKRRVKNLFHVGDIYDTLFIEEAHNMTLPDWSAEIYPEKMRWMSWKSFDVIAATPEMQRLRGGPLLNELIRNMEYAKLKDSGKAVEDVRHLLLPKAKVYIYSGHDTTISALLKALGVFDGKNVPYGTSVLVELYRSETLQKEGILSSLMRSPKKETEYIVKIFYKKDIKLPPEELSVPNCEHPCRLSQLRRARKHVLADDWKSECGDLSEKQYAPSPGLGVYLLSILFALGFLLIALLGFFFITRKHSQNQYRGVLKDSETLKAKDNRYNSC